MIHRETSQLICISVDVDDMQRLNNDRGYIFGDSVLEKIGATLRELFLQHAAVIRNTSDEFVLLIEGLSMKDSRNRMERCKELIAWSHNARISYGIGIGDAATSARRISLAAMFSSKRRNRFEDKNAPQWRSLVESNRTGWRVRSWLES